jgi:hypothetical protein
LKLNASQLCQVMLFKMPAIWMHLYCIMSCFSKCHLVIYHVVCWQSSLEKVFSTKTPFRLNPCAGSWFPGLCTWPTGPRLNVNSPDYDCWCQVLPFKSCISKCEPAIDVKPCLSEYNGNRVTLFKTWTSYWHQVMSFKI